MSKESFSRGLEIVGNPAYRRGAMKQFSATVFGKNYAPKAADVEKPTICFLPGWTADLGAYQPLLSGLENDFNILPVQDLPEGLKAVFSTLGIDKQGELVLQTLENAGALEEKTNIVGHSNGGMVAAYVKARLSEIEGSRSKIGKVVTLSSPLSGSREIAHLPVVSSLVKAVSDLDPESEVMKKITENGQVDHRFVTTEDELFTLDEMDFHNGVKHLIKQGHFEYMLGTKAQVAQATAQITGCLIDLPTT